MSAAERAILRCVAYGAYLLGVVGFSFSLGSPWGWLVLAAAGLLPGGFLLHRDMDRRRDDRTIAKAGARPYQAPPPRTNGEGAAPAPLTPPQY